jgi:hypothetical protein
VYPPLAVEPDTSATQSHAQPTALIYTYSQIMISIKYRLHFNIFKKKHLITRIRYIYANRQTKSQRKSIDQRILCAKKDVTIKKIGKEIQN